MKNLAKILSLLLVLVVVTFFSCSKEDLKIFASMSAKIDGTQWDSSARVTVLEADKFVITGTSLSGEVIAITILGSDEGTYTLAITPPSAECSALYKASASTSTEDAYVSSKGEVVLTKVDKTNKKISGTFKFTVTRLTETMEITEGEFEDLSYNTTGS